MRFPERLVLCATTEKMRDGDKNHRAECCRGQREEKAAAEDSQFSENPAADERADQAQDDVGDTAEAAAARQFSGEPSSNKAEKEPCDDSTRPPFDDYRSVFNQCQSREHAVSILLIWTSCSVTNLKRDSSLRRLRSE